MNESQPLTIGVLSKRTDVHIETIRHYERIGLLPKPARSVGGHRHYTNDDTRRLIFVRRSRELGFSLDEVRALLGLAGGRHMVCSKVKNITEQHLAAIRHK